MLKNKNNSQARLILLAIIENLPNSTREFILDCSVKSLYLDYFTAAEALDTLLEQHLVHDALNKKELKTTADGQPVSRINITEQGASVLGALRHTLPQQITDFLLQTTCEKVKENQLTAHYKMSSEATFQVHLAEQNRTEIIISIELSVPTEKIAQTICQAWLNHAEIKYAEIFSILMKGNADDDRSGDASSEQ